jgi:hypothetical protein
MDNFEYDDYVKRMPISAADYARLTEQSPVTVSRKRNGKLPIPFFEAALMAGFAETSKFVRFLEGIQK